MPTPNTPRYTTTPNFGPIPNFPFCGAIAKPLPTAAVSRMPPNLKFESYAPYIILRFQNFAANNNSRARDYGYTITTGNLSGPNRSASIKSMSYGISNKGTAVIEIIDTSGNDFVNFYASLVTDGCLSSTPPGNLSARTQLGIALDFGWIFTSSSGATTIYSIAFANITKFVRTTGPYIYFSVTDIEVNYEGGVWKYKVHTSTPDSYQKNQSTAGTYGSQRQKQFMMDAFSRHLNGDCKVPKKPREVLTARKNPDGSWSPYNFENARTKGPRGVFPGFNDTPLDAIRKNLDVILTDRGRGVNMFYNAADPEQSLYLVEGPIDECKSKGSYGYKCKTAANSTFLGTYIVNGGDMSPVISFSPQIKFTTAIANNTGAGSSGSVGPKFYKIPDCFDGKEKPVSGATVVTQSAVRDSQLTHKSPKNVGVKLTQSARANIQAQKNITENFGALEADLVIQGDPRLCWPHFITGGVLSVIFVNPFSIKTEFNWKGQTNTGYWLAQPATNAILSKSLCQVKSVDHEISEGKWETKLKIRMLPDDKTS